MQGKPRLARKVKTIISKGGSVDGLLSIVQTYAGEEKMARMKVHDGLNKTMIAEWISAAETLALGPPQSELNNGQGMTVYKNNFKAINNRLVGPDDNEYDDEPAAPPRKKIKVCESGARDLPTNSKTVEELQSKQSSSNIKPPLPRQDCPTDDSANMAQDPFSRPHKPHKPRRPHHSTSKTSQPSNMRRQEKSSQRPQNSPLRPFRPHKDQPSSTRLQTPQPPLHPTVAPSTKPTDAGSLSPEMAATNRHPSKAFSLENPAINKKMLMAYDNSLVHGRHVLIDTLRLDPGYYMTSCHLYTFSDGDKALVSAISWTEVHVTWITRELRKLARPSKTAYLKPGPHGWDYSNHKWTWEGDRDLDSGAGHQVERADMEKLNNGEMRQAEFWHKYPGRMESQWPCGCQKPWQDDFSEEE
ncbi:hypothetical protein EJ04DRAFT_560998 [Polyplosphaeria fusca]|uniref:Uncharacterized protein n=1 Tax=Polyplosphaeria fusca TaxID=682080 RepID=A0A9P4R797_9PLEO|nr:hypothetical protein EJ04DRAFT_560998 [Polyplosphaeria fusca]